MYPAIHAARDPGRIAFIMADSGQQMTYGELDRRSNQLARLLRAQGLVRLDHYAVFMENNAVYLESVAAGERTGLYCTCISSYLAAEEMAYIVNNSESQVLITSAARAEVALAALPMCPRVRLCLIWGGPGQPAVIPAQAQATDCTIADYESSLQPYPAEPVPDESLGATMLYSSGTTGRPKGILRPVHDDGPASPLSAHAFVSRLWACREDMVYLSPAPLYHAAPSANVSVTIRAGGTVIIMERFDPLRFLELVEKYKVTHSQLVPTMFTRMLKLPRAQRERYDLSSLEFIVHAAAPCPQEVKREMIAWWGPVIHEYYGSTESIGFSFCNTEEWLAHPGTVGKVMRGELHILDEAGRELPVGQAGELWFKPESPFEYYNDPERTAQSRSADGSLSTVGDIGYLDEEGYLYLTDRSTFMIISGGVNIYPQEAEDRLITHPDVMDAAVFGVPNEDLGEEVKAVVQLVDPKLATPQKAEELIAWCRERLTHLKCPRTLEFIDALPRLPTGKLYKKALRDKYWPAANGQQRSR